MAKFKTCRDIPLAGSTSLIHVPFLSRSLLRPSTRLHGVNRRVLRFMALLRGTDRGSGKASSGPNTHCTQHAYHVYFGL